MLTTVGEETTVTRSFVDLKAIKSVSIDPYNTGSGETITITKVVFTTKP